MKRSIGITLLMLGLTVSAYPQQYATWTGQIRFFTTVTGQQAVRCEYIYQATQKFWVNFLGTHCPQTVKVQ